MAAKVYEDQSGRAKIEWVPEHGPLEGKTLRGGSVQCNGNVMFPGHRFPFQIAAYPDLAATAAEILAHEGDN